jgi:hypothetical protein
LVLVDDLHSRETFPGVRPRNGHRSGIEVENRERIQGVAIRPNSGDSLYLAPLRRNPDWIFVLFLIYTSVEELNARLGDGELMKYILHQAFAGNEADAAGSGFARVSGGGWRTGPVTQQQGRHFSLQILTPNLHLAALEKGNSRSRAGARLRIFPTIRC